MVATVSQKKQVKAHLAKKTQGTKMKLKMPKSHSGHKKEKQRQKQQPSVKKQHKLKPILPAPKIRTVKARRGRCWIRRRILKAQRKSGQRPVIQRACFGRMLNDTMADLGYVATTKSEQFRVALQSVTEDITLQILRSARRLTEETQRVQIQAKDVQAAGQRFLGDNPLLGALHEACLNQRTRLGLPSQSIRGDVDDASDTTSVLRLVVAAQQRLPKKVASSKAAAVSSASAPKRGGKGSKVSMASEAAAVVPAEEEAADAASAEANAADTADDRDGGGDDSKSADAVEEEDEAPAQSINGRRGDGVPMDEEASPSEEPRETGGDASDADDGDEKNDDGEEGDDGDDGGEEDDD